MHVSGQGHDAEHVAAPSVEGDREELRDQKIGRRCAESCRNIPSENGRKYMDSVDKNVEGMVSTGEKAGEWSGGGWAEIEMAVL